MISCEIREDDLSGPEIVRFLRDHLDYMYAVTPPESVHAFDLERLRAPRGRSTGATASSRARRSRLTAKIRTAFTWRSG